MTQKSKLVFTQHSSYKKKNRDKKNIYSVDYNVIKLRSSKLYYELKREN